MPTYLEYLADEVFPWVIGCTGFLKIVLGICYRFHGKLPIFLGPSTWLASIQIYIGTAVDVLVCFGSLLRINVSYLAIVPFIVISFICVLWMKLSRLSDRGDVKSGSSRTGTDDGKKSTVMPEEFNVVVLLAPHIILCVTGMVGDPDHDGNNYDISNFFLFLTCMLQELTLLSSGIAPASELLYKASLGVLLLTAHVLAVNAFGKNVALLLLPEIAPPLLWFSVHLDRGTSVINVQKIVGGEHYFSKAVVVAMCGFILQVVPKNEYLLYWASLSCIASGLLTYLIVLVLRMWPEEAGFTTLDFEEVVELLTFWGRLLLQVAVGLFALGGAAQVYRSSITVVY